MASHSQTYKHLVGKNVDEAVEALKAEGMEPRVYQALGYVRPTNPKMVQLQVDPDTNKVKNVG